MAKKVFGCQAIIPKNGLKSMADGGIRVLVDTNELTDDQAAVLFSFKGQEGYFMFAASKPELEDLDIPDVTPEFRGEKTPSQRLRAILYRLWEQNGASGTFEVYYRTSMEKIMTSLKDKLDD